MINITSTVIKIFSLHLLKKCLIIKAEEKENPESVLLLMHISSDISVRIFTLNKMIQMTNTDV